MSVSNGIIIAPVSIDDVNNVLGHGSTDLGTLCNSLKIAKYSKKKPVVYNSASEITDAQRKEANYGFSSNMPYWIRIASMATGYMTNNPTPENNAVLLDDSWTYVKPDGANWKRLTDFDGYWHGATTPMVGTLVTQNASFKEGQSTMLIQFQLAPSDNSVLNLADLGLWSGNAKISEFANMYFGVCFYFSSSKYYFFTQSTKISELQSQGASLWVTSPSSLVGTCTCFAFCSSIAYTSLVSSDSNTGYFVPIPMSKSTLVVTQASYDISLVATTAYRETRNSQIIHYVFDIINGESSNYNVSGYITVSILDSNGTVLKSLQPYNNSTINASTTTRFSNSINTQSTSTALKAKTFKVSCTILGKLYESSCAVTTGPSPIL